MEMETLEQIKARAEAAVPGAKIDIVLNPGPSQQSSLKIDNEHAAAVARFLRDDPALKLDFCSNATGVDWPEKKIVETTKTPVPDPAGGPAKIIETKTERLQPGYLEVVYHLYSMALKHGPVIVRLRTGDRADNV